MDAKYKEILDGAKNEQFATIAGRQAIKQRHREELTAYDKERRVVESASRKAANKYAEECFRSGACNTLSDLLE